MHTTTTPRQRDYQRARVYRWERSFVPEDRGPSELPVKGGQARRMPPGFLEFYAEAWQWGAGRWGWEFNYTPRVRIDFRQRRTSGKAGFYCDRGVYKYGISLAWPRLDVLLHETAHLFALGDRHGPVFCRRALDLYVRFLGADEARALELAAQHGVEVAP